MLRGRRVPQVPRIWAPGKVGVYPSGDGPPSITIDPRNRPLHQPFWGCAAALNENKNSDAVRVGSRSHLSGVGDPHGSRTGVRSGQWAVGASLRFRCDLDSIQGDISVHISHVLRHREALTNVPCPARESFAKRSAGRRKEYSMICGS